MSFKEELSLVGSLVQLSKCDRLAAKPIDFYFNFKLTIIICLGEEGHRLQS